MVTMAQIEELVRRIGQQFYPERIVLFGSYASGQAKNYEKNYLQLSCEMVKYKKCFSENLAV